jgi:hypothetical protein
MEVLVTVTGVINLRSAVTASLPDRVALLANLSPSEIRHSAHLFTALSDFFC